MTSNCDPHKEILSVWVRVSPEAPVCSCHTQSLQQVLVSGTFPAGTRCDFYSWKQEGFHAVARMTVKHEDYIQKLWHNLDQCLICPLPMCFSHLSTKK